jgi:poly-gamma-glutamate synthesis protein (capsule biosynthesis protein)
VRSASSLYFYEQVDRNPGSQPRIITLTNKDDLTAMIDDIAKTKSSADVVIISMHWGVHYVPALIAMYQRKSHMRRSTREPI